MLNELTGFVRVGDLSGKGEIPEKAYVVFLERTDSSHWRKKSAALRAFPEEVEGLEELSDEAISSTDRLWIFQQR
jgi:hypothetical protein